MATPVTLRLRDEDRRTLEREAEGRGLGLSTLLRDLAEAEAKRIRRAAIREEGQRIVNYVATDAKAEQELDELGTPQGDA